MQMAAPELLRFLQGIACHAGNVRDEQGSVRPFATNCPLARRLVERGTRFVMLMHASWDDHTELNTKLKKNCDITDQPAAALIKDLKQRGFV
jgi:hypothetical protein